MKSGNNNVAQHLSDVEKQVIDLFVHVANMISYPRSVGQLYGMLFVSSEALCMDDLTKRLGMSKGSASQGLRVLSNFGAVTTVYVPGDRRQHYQAEMNLRKVLTNFLRNQFGANLAGIRERLESIDALLGVQPEGENGVLRERIESLTRWQGHAEKLAPLIMGLISTDDRQDD